MAKYSVNLIIKSPEDSGILRKLKLILPVIAVVLTIIFVLTYLISIGFITSNSSGFELLTKETNLLEKQVADKKEAEAIYTVTLGRLTVLDKLMQNNADFNKLINGIYELNSNGISIKSINADSKGNINLSVVATSADALDSFVELLSQLEIKKQLSEILAQGIVREKTGDYHVNLNLKGNLAFLK